MMTNEKRQEVLNAKERIISLRKSLMVLQSGDNGEIPMWLDDATHEFRKQLGSFEQELERYLKYNQ